MPGDFIGPELGTPDVREDVKIYLAGKADANQARGR